jgi:hypothetical protein
MTDPRALVAAAELPDGWSLNLVELRQFRHVRTGRYIRSLWRIEAIYRALVRARWDTYRVGAALPAVIAWIEAHPVEPDIQVTVDGDGWVRSIEEVAS